MSERGLKIKVGALLMFSAVLLIGFLVILGQFSVGEKRTLYIELTDSGSVLAGAPVKIAGVRAGRIEVVDFLVARDARKSKGIGAPINVRLTVSIDVEMAPALTQDAQFFITTQGVLGEKYLEIVPGTKDAVIWPDGSYIRGVDPPRLDLMFTKAENIMTQVETVLSGDLNLNELVGALTRVTKTIDQYLIRNADRLDVITANLETMSSDGKDLVSYLKHGVGSPEQITAILGDTHKVMGTLAREVGPMTGAARRTLSKAESALGDVQELVADNKDRLAQALEVIPTVAARADSVMRDVAYVTEGIKQGRGTVGQLLVDQEIYDDLKEMLRDLKRHPWKFLWRE